MPCTPKSTCGAHEPAPYRAKKVAAGMGVDVEPYFTTGMHACVPPADRRAAIICGGVAAFWYEAGEALMEKLQVAARYRMCSRLATHVYACYGLL